MGFADAIKQHKADITYLVTLDTLRGRAWYYLRVARAKAPMFLKAMERPNIELAEFGSILARGFGAEPPEAVRQRFVA